MLKIFADWLTFSLMRFAPDGRTGEVISYFIYDVIKIAVLLFLIIGISSFLRSYLPREKVRAILSTKFKLLGHLLAAGIGIITPFCSCSAVPLFIGFVESGVPLGVTFSYLISAPMVNEVAAIILFGLFGWKIALMYILSGVIIAVVSGLILGRMNIKHLVVENAPAERISKLFASDVKKDLKDRIIMAMQYTADLFKNIFPYVILGVAIGAFIHGYAPENMLTKIAGKNNPLAVPVAVIIGVPLYSNAAGVVPVVKSLVEKGLPIGTTLAFMMAVTALSIPEMIILRKILKPKLLGIFVAIITIGIIFTGYLFNWLV